MVLGVNPAGKFPAFLSMATATATSSAIATGTGGVPFGTGKSGAISTGVSKPSGTGAVSIPLFTGGASATRSVIQPLPTFTAGTHFKGRRTEGKPWFA